MFGLTTELPIIYSLFCILVGIVYAYLLYRNNKFENKILIRLLFVFRSVIVSVLVFLLLNPFISNISTYEEKPIVVLAQDVSISCGGFEDSVFFASLSDKLSTNFDVIEYNYSEDVSEGFLSKKKGESTDISNLLDEVELKYSGRNLSAIVTSSDGLYNKGSNPLYHKFSKSVPIHTIAIGDTSVFKDVNISNVLYNEISFLDNISPIEVQIKTEKCKGEILSIELYSDNNSVVIRHNTDPFNSPWGLCYVDTINWSLLTVYDQWINDNGPVCSDCYNECNGCWGPGPQLCQLCKNYLSGFTCIQQCPNGTTINGSICIEHLPEPPILTSNQDTFFTIFCLNRFMKLFKIKVD